MATYRYPFRLPWKITLDYGVKGTLWKAGFHSGVDLVSKACRGDGEVHPIADGVVDSCIWGHKSYGNYITVRHDDGMLSLYAHLEKIMVGTGKHVNSATVLGIEGATGNVTGRHLHLEIHKGAYHYPATIDPVQWITAHIKQEEAEKMGYSYLHLPKMHAVRIDPAKWRVVDWQRGKRTTAIKNYCAFAFQASGRVPVGNIVADGVTLAKLATASTIWVDGSGNIGVGFSPPAGAKQAVSGFPLRVLDREYSLKEALAQGWDTTPLYATSHAMLGVSGDTLIYYIVETTAKMPETTWTELQSIARMTGCHTVLLGDGGGSTILDIEGKNAVASAGNRQLATLMQF
ncbi:MAG: peptidoglycan DD-metalloendopeptidase family protein [Clostridia bacterium]|nr:peptidoglycan DD-metalloendopeptidase family protein [Clostridia bacterium]